MEDWPWRKELYWYTVVNTIIFDPIKLRNDTYWRVRKVLFDQGYRGF